MQSRPDLRKHNHDSSYAQINHKHDDPSPSGNRSVYTRPSRQIISGAGLTGGGDLTADRTLAVGAGTGLQVTADAVELTAAAIASLAKADTAVQPARQIISGDGLTGGGDLSGDRTLAVGAGSGIAVAADSVAVDINALTADATPDGETDYVMTYDASASTLKKVLLDDLPGGGSGVVETIVEGAGINVNDADPANPIVSLDPTVVPVLATGTYTPTAAAITNLDAISNVRPALWMRLGDSVYVAGIVDTVDPTAAGAVEFTLTLPIASNLANHYDLSGVCSNRASPDAGTVEGSVASDVARVRFAAASGGSRPVHYSFFYKVV